MSGSFCPILVKATPTEQLGDVAHRHNTSHLRSLVFAADLFFFLIFILFYFWPRWVFVAARGLSLVASSEGYSSLRRAGFSLQWLLLLQSTGSRVRGLQ